MQDRSELLDNLKISLKNVADHPETINDNSMRDLENKIITYMTSYMDSQLSAAGITTKEKEEALKDSRTLSKLFNQPIDDNGNTIMHYIADTFNSTLKLESQLIERQETRMKRSLEVFGNKIDENTKENIKKNIQEDIDEIKIQTGEKLGQLNLLTMNMVEYYGGDLTAKNNEKESPYTRCNAMAQQVMSYFPQAFSDLELVQSDLKEKLSGERRSAGTTEDAASNIRKILVRKENQDVLLHELETKLNNEMEKGTEIRMSTEQTRSSQYYFLNQIKAYKNELYKRPRSDQLSRTKADQLSDFIFKVENAKSNEDRGALVDEYIQSSDLARHHEDIFDPVRSRKNTESQAVRLLKAYQNQLIGKIDEVTPITTQNEMTSHLFEKTVDDLNKINTRPSVDSHDILLVTMDPKKDSLKKLAILEKMSNKNGNNPVLIKNGNDYYVYGLSKKNKWDVTKIDNTTPLTGLPFPANKYETKFNLDSLLSRPQGNVDIYDHMSVIDTPGLRDAISEGHDPNTYKNQQKESVNETRRKMRELDKNDPNNMKQLLGLIENTIEETRDNRKKMKMLSFDRSSSLDAELRRMRNELRHEIDRTKSLPLDNMRQDLEKKPQQEAAAKIDTAQNEKPQPQSAKSGVSKPLPVVPKPKVSKPQPAVPNKPITSTEEKQKGPEEQKRLEERNHYNHYQNLGRKESSRSISQPTNVTRENAGTKDDVITDLKDYLNNISENLHKYTPPQRDLIFKLSTTDRIDQMAKILDENKNVTLPNDFKNIEENIRKIAKQPLERQASQNQIGQKDQTKEEPTSNPNTPRLS